MQLDSHHRFVKDCNLTSTANHHRRRQEPSRDAALRGKVDLGAQVALQGKVALGVQEDPPEKVVLGAQVAHKEADPQEKVAHGGQVAQVEVLQDLAVHGAQVDQQEVAQVVHGPQAAQEVDTLTQMATGLQ